MLTRRISNRVSRAYRQAKYSIRNISYSVGLNLSFFRNARGARILVYHGICAKDHLQFNTLFLTKEVFESQLRFYKKYFNVVSLDDYYQCKFDESRFNVCLSFDDGFANNHKYVLPLLEQYKLPAAFLITSVRDAGYDILWTDIMSIAYKYGPASIQFSGDNFIKKNRDYVSSSTGQRLVDVLRSTESDEKEGIMELLMSVKQRTHEDYWLQMTADQIKHLSASKWATIGSHSHFHHDLAKISRPVLTNDLVRSKRYLENVTGKEIKALAFPFGSYNESVVQEAKRAGYQQLLATEFLFADSRHDTTMRERLTLNPFISVFNQMHAIVKGRY